ncbi:MAG: Pyrophosphatase PpaX [Candidatus Parcubacteria bacterium]|jgi:HAD superfamily hydrolase (TIGR01549 family)
MSTSSYNYLLFDWDGCLAASLHNALVVYRETFAEYGMNPSDAEIVAKAFGDWNPSKNFEIKNNQEFIDKVVKGITARMPYVGLYDGVKETLETLKMKNKKMAIVTSSRRDTVLPALRNLKIDHIFDCFLGKEDFIKEKPDPEILHKAMKEIRAVKEETLIVGDSDKDILAGKNAEITTVVFYPRNNELFYTPETIQNLHADYLIKDFRDLLTIAQ